LTVSTRRIRSSCFGTVTVPDVYASGDGNSQMPIFVTMP
jgi:hypothetical protein